MKIINGEVVYRDIPFGLLAGICNPFMYLLSMVYIIISPFIIVQVLFKGKWENIKDKKIF